MRRPPLILLMLLAALSGPALAADAPAPGAANPQKQSQNRSRDHHLGKAQGQHIPAHPPELRGLRLQSNDKEQENDAQLRELAQALGTCGHVEAPRSEDHTGRQQAKNRTETQPLGKTDHQVTDGQHHDGRPEEMLQAHHRRS